MFTLSHIVYFLIFTHTKRCDLKISFTGIICSSLSLFNFHFDFMQWREWKNFVGFEIKIKAFYFDGHDIQSEKFSRNKHTHTHSSRYIITLKYRIFGWVVFNETCYLRFLVVISFSFSYCVIFFTSSKSYHTALYYVLLYICAISCNRNLKKKKKTADRELLINEKTKNEVHSGSWVLIKTSGNSFIL